MGAGRGPVRLGGAAPVRQELKPAFRRIASDAQKGLMVKPLLHAYLYEARFPEDFSVNFRKHSLDHGPDGWFHPSTHPLWPERKLYLYLAHPEKFIAEEKGHMGVLSITMGTAMHGFVSMCLDDLGVLVKPPADEPCRCGDPECDEWYVEDVLTGARGHQDGRLAINGGRQGFEFKTISPKARLPEDLDLDWLKEKHPDYYAQQQEYMRLSGYRFTVILFLVMGYPWESREIHIPYDAAFAEGVADKYLRVRAALADREIPRIECCKPRSATARACEVRAACPVGCA